MFRILLALAIALAVHATPASAGTTIVEDFRGTVQTVTSTGAITLSLGANTTIVRVNTTSDVYIVGMDGGYDGRVVLFTNAGTANAYFYHEHTGASSAAARFVIDANTGYRVMYSGINSTLGWAVYDATSSRWRWASINGFNTGGGLAVNGDLSTIGNFLANGSISGGNGTLAYSGTTRLTLKPTSATNNGSTLQWQNSAGTSLFSMGPDYYGNTGKDFWLYDGWNGVTNMHVNNTGTSYLSFGTSAGGLQYAESGDELGVFASGLVRMRLTSGGLKISTLPYYQRKTTGTAKPTMGADCAGSSSATQHADSSDYRGSVTLGTGATSCTLSFAIPWDLTGNNVGLPICTANTSTSGRTVAVTSLTDHEVVFTPSASGPTTIYYHCDGIYPPQ